MTTASCGCAPSISAWAAAISAARNETVRHAQQRKSANDSVTVIKLTESINFHEIRKDSVAQALPLEQITERNTRAGDAGIGGESRPPAEFLEVRSLFERLGG